MMAAAALMIGEVDGGNDVNKWGGFMSAVSHESRKITSLKKRKGKKERQKAKQAAVEAEE